MIISTVYLFSISIILQDCMYLHELGDGAGSFTKDDMQAGLVFLYSLLFLSFGKCFITSMFPSVAIIHISPEIDIFMSFFRKHQEYEQQLIAFYSKKM